MSRWLTEAGIAHALLKGPTVAVFHPEGDREFLDLDVLVAPAQMAKAIEVLEREGAYVLDPQGWPRDDGVGEVAIGLPPSAVIDLHADLIHQADVRRAFRIPTEPLLARLTTAEMLGQLVPVLDSEDTLIYVALHAALSGGDRLIWLADLDAIVRGAHIRWPVLIGRALEGKVALVVAVMLERASLVLETPIPPEASRALKRKGRLWTKLLTEFERRRPTASNYGRAFHGQVLVRATRSSTLTSMLTLARLIWSDVIVAVSRDRGHPWRKRFQDHAGRRSVE